MVRKVKPLITGLLGLAGLGLLPQGAEASPALDPALDPALGTTTAPDPSPVAVPEPSAQPAPPQTTAPQAAADAAPQPAWTPGVEDSVVAAAAPGVAPQPNVAVPEPVATSQPAAVPQADAASQPVSTSQVADVPQVAEAPPTAAALAIAAPVAAPAVADGDTSATDPPLDAAGATGAASPIAPPPSPGVTPLHPEAAHRGEGHQGSAEQSARDRQAAIPADPLIPDVVTAVPQAAVASPAGALAAPTPDPKPVATKGTLPVLAGPSGALAPAPALEFGRPARATAPAIAARLSGPAAAPRPASVGTAPAPDVAALRARAQAVQALLRDLRSAYALGEPGTPQGQRAVGVSDRPGVAQPEVRSRGPQLPPLRSQRSLTRAAAASPVEAAIASGDGRLAAPGWQRSPRAGTVSDRPGPRAGNVALALAPPQPAMSPSGTGIATGAELALPSPAIAAAPLAPPPSQAQANPTPPSRESLRVEPLTAATGTPSTFPPSPNAGIPSAFGADWGDVFISASLAGADRVRPEADGSLSMGFGLGDAQRLVGLELAYNLLSVRNFGSNGSFDAKLHRQVYSSDETQVAAAVGLNSFATYGTNASGLESSLYGVVTAAHLLQPDHPVNPMPITATVGLGGGSFAGEGSDVGVIAGVGLQVHPQVSVNTAWSGVGLNVGASIVPVPTLPLTLNLLYGDIGNNTRPGSVAVISVGYGFNFAPRF